MAMASSVYDTGYEDELFQYPVGPSFHCCICTNVIKDPVMCHNEHIFCRACITRHLMNYHTCPTCMQPLTVETLRQAPRGIRNLLSELQIRCKFFDRGCGKFVQLADLERHVADCCFAPTVCSNEGCQLEVNKHDLLHHETAVCELRRVKCHSCNDIRREMDTVKVDLAAMNVKLDRNCDNQSSNANNVKAVAAKVELVQQQLNKQEESNRRLEADNIEIKKSLNEIMKQLEKITQEISHEVRDGPMDFASGEAQQTSYEVQAEEMKKGVAGADVVDREPKVVIVGGEILTSVEMFSLATGTWTLLQPITEFRQAASSVVHNNHIFVIFGYSFGRWLRSMEKLSLNAVHANHSIAWENVELSGTLTGHHSVVYNGRVMVIGGYDSDKKAYSNRITEISLVPPCTNKQIATMPQKRGFHGVAIFGDKILIVGGKVLGQSRSFLKSVVMYDITKKKFKELAPLPYPLHSMASVKWDDENMMIMGVGVLIVTVNL